MHKNLKKAFLVLGSILLLGQSVGAMLQEEMQKEQDRRAIRNERAKAVRDHIDSSEKSIDKLNLVIGVIPSNDEEVHGKGNVTKRFDSSWVFLGNGYKSELLPGRELTADFNNVEDLEYLANIFEGRFDSIVMDASVYKFTRWGIPHMKQFERLLRPGGVFMFEPEFAGGVYRFQEYDYEPMKPYPLCVQTKDELIEKWRREEEAKDSQEFFCQGSFPATFMEYGMLGFGGLDDRHTKSVEGYDEENLRSYLQTGVINEEIEDLFYCCYRGKLGRSRDVVENDVLGSFQNVIFSNWKKRLAEIFGSAKYDETVRYPFQPNYPKINGLFVCTKKS